MREKASNQDLQCTSPKLCNNSRLMELFVTRDGTKSLLQICNLHSVTCVNMIRKIICRSCCNGLSWYCLKRYARKREMRYKIK